MLIGLCRNKTTINGIIFFTGTDSQNDHGLGRGIQQGVWKKELF